MSLGVPCSLGSSDFLSTSPTFSLGLPVVTGATHVPSDNPVVSSVSVGSIAESDALVAITHPPPVNDSSVNLPSISWEEFLEQDSSTAHGAIFSFDDLYPSNFDFEAYSSLPDPSPVSDHSGFLGSGRFLEM